MLKETFSFYELLEFNHSFSKFKFDFFYGWNRYQHKLLSLLSEYGYFFSLYSLTQRSIFSWLELVLTRIL